MEARGKTYSSNPTRRFTRFPTRWEDVWENSSVSHIIENLSHLALLANEILSWHSEPLNTFHSTPELKTFYEQKSINKSTCVLNLLVVINILLLYRDKILYSNWLVVSWWLLACYYNSIK